MQRKQQSGFTLIELIVVVAVLAIISSFAILGFQSFANYQRYERSVAEAVSLIEQSRTDARSAVGEERHGVKILSSSIVQFSGDVYAAGDPDNVVTDFSNVIFIPNFPGSIDEIIFTQLTAVPSATGTIDIVNANIPATTTLTITAAGVIQ